MIKDKIKLAEILSGIMVIVIIVLLVIGLLYKKDDDSKTSETSQPETFQPESDLPATAFSKDSWSKIASGAKKCINNPNSCPYKVGNEKKVDVGKYGKHIVRVSNISTPSECNDNTFSQSACGFVVEFSDIVTEHNMNPKGEYKGKTYYWGWNKDGWPASQMYKFLNDESLNGKGNKELSIINALPRELKKVIIDTKTVSGHGTEDTDNIVSIDKLYLLAPKEIYGEWYDQSDTLKDRTRQLDYYNAEVSEHDKLKTKKSDSAEIERHYWLRSATATYSFYVASNFGAVLSSTPDFKYGVSPAFRIG